MNKVASMRDAVAELVLDGDTVAIEGFTHLISFAAGHEIIRQRRRDLTLARLTPDLIYDQMLAAGNYVSTLEARQGLKIGCPEEIAWRQGWLTDAELEERAAGLAKSGYGQYLRQLLLQRR